MVLSLLENIGLFQTALLFLLSDTSVQTDLMSSNM